MGEKSETEWVSELMSFFRAGSLQEFIQMSEQDSVPLIYPQQRVIVVCQIWYDHYQPCTQWTHMCTHSFTHNLMSGKRWEETLTNSGYYLPNSCKNYKRRNAYFLWRLIIVEPSCHQAICPLCQPCVQYHSSKNKKAKKIYKEPMLMRKVNGNGGFALEAMGKGT